jgi:hypothetical protein
MIFDPSRGGASQFWRRGSFLAFFSGGAFPQALNDLLLLFSEEFSHSDLGLEETIGTIGMREEKIG